MFCHTQSIQELEQCDDIGNICMNKNCLLLNENNIQQDNINQLNTLDNIKTYCSLDCEVCLNGECLQCINGYFLNYVNRSCEAQCGDLIVSGFEECDDGNTDNYDGCVNCKLINYQHCNQENQQCEVCHYGYCIKCKEGVFLDNHSCFSFCGDGLLNNLEEECDNLLGIGCIDCKVQDGYVCNELNYSICNTCVEECILCEVENQKELKCQACIDGYYPVDSDCLPCNLNCITCKEDAFICTSCYRDDCELCETVSGLQTNFDLKICTATCGDGIKAIDYEYCDDGNLEDGDGCDSECKLEQSDLIINQLQDWDYQGNSSYNLGLKSNPYNFKLDCNTSLVTIDQFNQDEFQYNASVAENNTCRFQFFFIKSIFSYNIIHVSFKLIQSTQKKLLQEDNQRVKFNINPKEQIYLSDDEKSQAQSIQSAQSTFGYIFLILIPISIITNLFDYLWTVLEILSWINNFYFLNVNYPFNVEVFFLNSDWSSIISFPTYQELNQPGCDYYFTAPPRFQNKGIDPLFFNNAQVPFMFILSAIVLYFVNYIILITFSFLDSIMNPNKIVKKKRLIIFHVSTISNENQQEFVQPAQQPKEYKCLKKFVQLLNQISKEFKNKIKQTISLCLLDIMLAILLQINYADNLSNYIVFFNYLLAYFSITLIIHQVYQSFLTLNIHNVLAENEFYKDKYEIYYDKINTELSIGFYFKFIGLLRKLFYTYFMVHYYYEPFIQTLLCFISSSLGLVILAYQNPFKTKGQFYITILSDFCLSSIIFIIMIFGIHDRLNIKFVEKNKVILGWIIISLVFLAIAVEICILLYELFLYFYNNLLSIKNLFRKCLNLKIETKEMKQSKVDNHMQVPQNKISHQKDTFKKSSIPFETLQI